MRVDPNYSSFLSGLWNALNIHDRDFALDSYHCLVVKNREATVMVFVVTYHDTTAKEFSYLVNHTRTSWVGCDSMKNRQNTIIGVFQCLEGQEQGGTVLMGADEKEIKIMRDPNLDDRFNIKQFN